MVDRSIEEKVRAASDTALSFVYEEVYGGRGLLDSRTATPRRFSGWECQ